MELLLSSSSLSLVVEDACIVLYIVYFNSGGGIVCSYRGGGCGGTGEQLGAGAHPIYTLAIICPLVTPTRQPPFNVPSIYHLVIVITALFFTFTAHVQFQFQLCSLNQFNQKGKNERFNTKPSMPLLVPFPVSILS